jgi:hypothetical protein
MLQYKVYMISGCSVPMYMHGYHSRGLVCKAGRAGSLIELQRIDARCSKRQRKPRHTGWNWHENGWIERLLGGCRSPKPSRSESLSNIEHLPLALCIKIQPEDWMEEHYEDAIILVATMRSAKGLRWRSSCAVKILKDGRAVEYLKLDLEYDTAEQADALASYSPRKGLMPGNLSL